MANRSDGPLGRMTAADASRALRHGRVIPLFQPIEALQTGACRGFEALARLSHNGKLIPPGTFMPDLSEDDRLCLFGSMLGESIALLKSQAAGRQDLYVSINVEISLLVSDDFVDVLQYFLERYDFDGERLVIEMLENEDVTDLTRLHASLDAIKGLGLSVALDDIGSAYASLIKIKTLPIDIFKLDRSFSIGLERHPEDLMFVMSILSLARGLGKRMIVEGIETPEVYDSLRTLGVELGQGYAIAAPMPARDVSAWLATRQAREPDNVPQCLLGAYAAHLSVVEACRTLRSQPLPIAWTPASTDHKNCVVGRLFTARDWHDTDFGQAHKEFHAVLSLYERDEARWKQGAKRFQALMKAAIAANPEATRCTPPARKRKLKNCGCREDEPKRIRVAGSR